MNLNQAFDALQSWSTIPPQRLEQALSVVIDAKGPAWLDRYPELFTHPRDTVDEESLGYHQCWQWVVMPYREVRFRDRAIYVFAYHIEALIS